LDFSATIDNEVIRWNSEFGLIGPPLQVFALLNFLDGSERSPFGPGPSIKLDEANRYAVLFAINELFPDRAVTGDVPDFEDILGPFDPEVVN